MSIPATAIAPLKLSRLFTPTYASLINSQLVFPALSLVVKPNELHSALARPLHVLRYEPERSGYYLGASLAYGIINGHPFMDGNKRTAFFLYNAYLRAQSLPGLTDQIAIDDHENLTKLADKFIQATCGKLDVEGLAADDSRSVDSLNIKDCLAVSQLLASH
ncbi:uncharacterized protein STEHIDRAFT_60608 [Stereum hirsutum FP-91666 SS1]|uniref:uncharacterized protein n=1 Tax=Stereum hirsutum (strain FP-91666) TaxID=721885 RepID=UPI00044496AB|nr:uncharacterized protein STEHIDRAFT_60608 [Stereum hirsutum FP-91666 SS1]EIM84739.1 hypothetical protein STEHIDRAFT_60608 [Stereum hirsutum FP-91666 SS1]